MDKTFLSLSSSVHSNDVEALIDDYEGIIDDDNTVYSYKPESSTSHKKNINEKNSKILIDVQKIQKEKLDRQKDLIDYTYNKIEDANYNKTTSDNTCNVCKYYGVVGNEFFNNHAQEPWPKDVSLFQPYEVEQILLPDNANCLAVQTFLKMCNLEYTVEARPNAEAMSPTGKVPFIKCGAFIVSELEGIVQFVGNKGISLTHDFSPEDKADMRAYMTLVNNVLGNAELYICWCDNETYTEVTKVRYGSIYPWPLNHIQPWKKRAEEIKRLKVLGWYNKTLDEVYNDVETCCQSLTDRLNKKEYFFGTRYSELDALVYAHLYLLLTISLPAHLGMIVRKFELLIEFCKRMHYAIYGEITDLEPKSHKNMHKRVVFQDKPTVAELPDEKSHEFETIKVNYSNVSLQI